MTATMQTDIEKYSILTVVLGLVLTVASVLQAQSSKGPAGLWRVQFAAPTGQRAVSMTINERGSRLSGQVTDEYGEYPLSGEFVDGHVTIRWSVSEEGKILDITMRGALDGDEIRGTIQLGDVGEGTLVARRTGDAG
jgi:hypothetical protein